MKDESLIARNLLPNKEYEFRVCALNEAGMSAWSDNSGLIEACNPTGNSYTSIRSCLRDGTLNCKVF